MITIRRINIGAAFRIGVVVSAIVSAIFGLLAIGLQSLFINVFVSVLTLPSADGPFATGTIPDLNAFSSLSLVFLCIFYLIGVVLSAIGGGIGAAVTALAYNLAAGWVGGLEIELESDEKGKRGAKTVEIFES